MNHKHIHTKTSICSWSENPIKTFWGQAQLNKSTIEICFGTFDTHTSSHIHVVKLSSQALQASINNCTLWPRYKALYLLSYLLLQVDTPTTNQSLCYFKILEDLLLPMWFQQNVQHKYGDLCVWKTQPLNDESMG